MLRRIRVRSTSSDDFCEWCQSIKMTQEQKNRLVFNFIFAKEEIDSAIPYPVKTIDDEGLL